MFYFMFWFDEKSDLIGKFNIFSEYYKFKKNEIESIFVRFMRNDEIVIEVIFYFYDFGFFIYVWDEIVFEIDYVEV